MVQVLHWNQRVLLSEYIKPQHPAGVYKYDMHSGNTANKVAHEHDRTVALWLEGVSPPIPTPIALGVVDTQRCVYWLCVPKLRYQSLSYLHQTHSVCSPRLDWHACAAWK